ncbi:hypothetical protein CALVIDRAFT_536438 [Calocera viscosa TUFC12733]|uniref:Uncharacterized protein n=1 Tax=Calocera viscosa (strain TUFC12733) TaxID=1330018 RepID=A0A167N7G3_CALVF|nr:hypothetical protein CALVIDRAFT_536438 [Calocera viscosa TUFC12733]
MNLRYYAGYVPHSRSSTASMRECAILAVTCIAAFALHDAVISNFPLEPDAEITL